MCRFLVVKSSRSTNLQPILSSFIVMAKKSHAFDGDWQGDGWGYSWLDKNNNWKIYKSLLPIWQDTHLTSLPTEIVNQIYMSKILIVHARSASFPQHKNVIEYNQPYITEPYSYVFNGLLKGVSLSLPGSIGAQKIWNLLQEQIKKHRLENALERTKIILQKNCKELQAINIAFSDKKNIYTLCYYSKHEEYYQLHHYKESKFQFISSEPLLGYSSTPIFSNQIIKL